MTQVLGTEVLASTSPKYWVKMFVALTLFALVAMAAWGAANHIKRRAVRAKNDLAAQTGVSNGPVFEVEA